jgi:hypothetical protein
MHINDYNIVQATSLKGNWDSKYQTLRLWHDIQMWGKLTFAAFKFHHSISQHECLLFLCLHGSPTEVYVKFLGDPSVQGGSTRAFQDIFTQECGKYPIVQIEQGLPDGYDRYSYSVDSRRQYFTARVIRDEVLGEKFIIVDVGISEKGYLKFNSGAAVVQPAIAENSLHQINDVLEV